VTPGLTRGNRAERSLEWNQPAKDQQGWAR